MSTCRDRINMFSCNTGCSETRVNGKPYTIVGVLKIREVHSSAHLSRERLEHALEAPCCRCLATDQLLLELASCLYQLLLLCWSQTHPGLHLWAVAVYWAPWSTHQVTLMLATTWQHQQQVSNAAAACTLGMQLQEQLMSVMIQRWSALVWQALIACLRCSFRLDVGSDAYWNALMNMMDTWSSTSCCSSMYLTRLLRGGQATLADFCEPAVWLNRIVSGCT